MSVTIYHNPRCSKSRQTLQIIEDNNIKPAVVEYLNQPPSKAELKSILKKLHLQARDIIRVKEQEFQKLGIDINNASEDQLVEAMITHPILIERPIVVNGSQAVVARPAEKVLEILSD